MATKETNAERTIAERLDDLDERLERIEALLDGWLLDLRNCVER